MSRTNNDSQSSQAKADQILHRFHHKLVQLLHHARSPTSIHSANDNPKSDKWFNLDLPEPDNIQAFVDLLRPYRSLSTTTSASPLVLHVLLQVPNLPPNLVLVSDQQGSHGRSQITPTPSYVLLETWVLDFVPSTTAATITDTDEIQLPTVYKTSLSLFRSLYTLLRILPVWSLSKRLRRTHSSQKLSITLHLAPDLPPNTLSFPQAPEEQRQQLETFAFPAISHPYGALSLSVRYLKESACNFSLASLESLLSSRLLISEEFTPTLSRNTLSFTPGSLPLRTSLPRSPPATPADKFVLRSPTISRAASASTAPNYPPQPFPTAAGSSSHSLPKSPPVPVRRPSLGSSSSPTSAVALNPFKTPAMIPSSSSPRASSPLSAGIVRPSPPNNYYTPSSLGDRRSVSTGTPSSMNDPRPTLPGAVPIANTTTSGSMPKRYSSSFSHRYMTQHGAGSEGSGSGSLGAGGSGGVGMDRGGSSLSPTGLGFGTSSPPRHSPRLSPAPVLALALHPIAPPPLTSLSDVDKEIERMLGSFKSSMDGIGTGGKGKMREQQTEPMGLQLGGMPTTSPTRPRLSSSPTRPRLSSSPRLLPSSIPSSPRPVPIPRHRPPTYDSTFDDGGGSREYDDYPRGGSGGGSEEIIGRMEIDDHREEQQQYHNPYTYRR